MDPMDAVAIYRTATHEKVPNSGGDSPHLTPRAVQDSNSVIPTAMSVSGSHSYRLPLYLFVIEWGSQYAARNSWRSH